MRPPRMRRRQHSAPPELGPEDAPEELADPDPEQQVQQDLDELAAKAERADEYLMLAQRTQADFENYRKRAARDAALAQERGVAKLAKELLPAIDSLDRALKAASEEESQITDGIRLVHTDLLQRCSVSASSRSRRRASRSTRSCTRRLLSSRSRARNQAPWPRSSSRAYRLGDSVLRPARVLVAA